MSIRFRLSDQAFLQQQALRIPLALLEVWVQPAWRGSAQLLSARHIAQLPAALRPMARRFIGLYIVSDGQGTITHIAQMTHRLANSAQEVDYIATPRSIKLANALTGTQAMVWGRNSLNGSGIAC
ncbi:hypothetical protein [Deefgea sp. CFH1-16]|uniref:hypothetical protein n=1 Tax=Deefgea sp. CFH1-16 TaxID=2675457 RepID=UPI0015F668CB|nr:hypothetical protein [Deefgea sp. CFH1-16]MBM5575215.1 hypothetical protein [Deefgea sp. CFH1-16]